MDKLDKFSAGVITVLVVWVAALVVIQFNTESSVNTGKREKQVAARLIDPNFEKKIDLAKKLITASNVEKAGQLVSELIAAYPYEGQPFMLNGDICLRKQEPIAAMNEYRKAVDLDPDFLDKKTKLFQGKKIKKTVAEAFAAVKDGLSSDPGNKQLKKDKKTIYYMLRKIAGSCG